MALAPDQHAALQQLGSVPGVVGSMVFQPDGSVAGSAFPAVFDPAGLTVLAGRLSADGWFQQWVSGDHGALDLRYVDGNVAIRSLDGGWLLVLCTAEANAQLLSMSLTQAVRRLRRGAPPPTGEFPLPGGVAAAPSPGASAVDRMRAIVRAELGEHATQAMEILAAAGEKPKDLLRAAGDIEKLTRLFIDRKRADEVGRRLRGAVGK
jgi:predicted regulator of Ras-like GTPase activity (Roadblock/LC7/MglB family)